MKRNLQLYLNDIYTNSKEILIFIQGLSYEKFIDDKKTVYAVMRALEIIGEAAKQIPISFRKKYPEVEWKNMAGLRDVLIHEYFGINHAVIWQIIDNKLPSLIVQLEKIIEEYKLSQNSIF